ncbi:type II toxin-antitoxin system RelE/ParE family toxin [Embleya sp. NPDC020886]|uniref:type II toxin-antitoxin system RelE/ParE family toxin n=1 Tax=Embleya sp. NPDC020886 TaxID=3363980 RepID=UPI0037A90484
MTYRVQYSDEAQSNVAALSRPTRRAFEADVNTLAADPYGRGSIALRGRDYREVLLGGCITVYWVSGAEVRVISVVRVQGPP